MLDASKIEGMTLRDYVAIAILQAWLMRDNNTLHDTPKIFESAYYGADQMLKVRKKLVGEK